MIPPIVIRIFGKENVGKLLTGLTGKISTAGKKMKRTGRSLTTGVTLPAMGIGFAVGRAAVSFDAAMNKVEAKSEVAGKSIQDLRNKAKELGSTTQFSATQAAEGMTFLAQAGFDTGKIYESIGPLLLLAATDSMELGDAANITSNIMAGFGMEASRTGEAVDILATITANSNVDMEQLGETMKIVGPVAKSFGADMKSTATVAGFLGNIGIQGTAAGTAMKKMFSGITSGKPKITKALKGLKVEVADSQGQIRSFADITTDLAGAITKLPQIEQLRVIETIFGERAKAGMSAMVADTGSLNSVMGKLSKTMSQDLTGNAQKMADTMNKGAVGGLRNFMSALEGIAIAIGESGLLEGISKVTRKVAGWFRWMSKLHPGILKIITVIGILAIVIPPLIWMMGSLAVAIAAVSWPVVAIVAGIGLLIAAITWLTIKWKTWGKLGKSLAGIFLFLLGPIGWVIAAIVLLANHWDSVVAGFKAGWKWVGKVGGAIAGIFGGGDAQQAGNNRLGAINGNVNNIISNQAGQTNTNNAKVKLEVEAKGANVKASISDNKGIIDPSVGLMGAGG